MSFALLDASRVSKGFGGLSALEAIDLAVDPDTIVALIGPNGAGKTTFFNCLTGLTRPDTGTIDFEGRPITGLAPHAITARGIARTFQNVRLFATLSARDNVMVGAYCRERTGLGAAILRSARARAERDEGVRRAEECMAFVGLASVAEVPAEALAYGFQRRLEIARALASGPRLLLLDEPAAGMNPTETLDLMALIRRIRERGIAVLLIEHDMRVVMGVSDRVIVFDHGVKIAEGSPAEIQGHPRVIEAYLGAGPAAGHA